MTLPNHTDQHPPQSFSPQTRSEKHQILHIIQARGGGGGGAPTTFTPRYRTPANSKGSPPFSLTGTEQQQLPTVYRLTPAKRHRETPRLTLSHLQHTRFTETSQLVSSQLPHDPITALIHTNTRRTADLAGDVTLHSHVT